MPKKTESLGGHITETIQNLGVVCHLGVVADSNGASSPCLLLPGSEPERQCRSYFLTAECFSFLTEYVAHSTVASLDPAAPKDGQVWL